MAFPKQQAQILIVGCGDLGSILAAKLVAQGHVVRGLRRRATSMPKGVLGLRGDVTKPETLKALPTLKPDFLVYCVAAGEQTDENYQAIYVEGLRNVLAALAPANSLKRVFFVSSTRVYGQKTNEILNENITPQPSDFGGVRLLEAENLLKNLPCPGTALRLSGIYAAGRTRMVEMAKTPQNWPKQNVWTNRIHRDDAASFIAFLIARILENNPDHEPIDDCYIVTDNRPTPQWKVLMWLAKRQKIEVSKLVEPPVAGGKRLSNFRMRTLEFKPQYEDYRAGYETLLHGDPLEPLVALKPTNTATHKPAINPFKAPSHPFKKV
jgi:nucleoside-diphosphate-sugar epimerase